MTEPSTVYAVPASLHRSVADRLRAAGCLYAEEEAQLLISSVPPPALHEKLAQRASGLPLEYVLGWARFHGHRVRLEPGVFIPRRRSEFLASLALQRTAPGDVLLDLCCGSGALALAVASPFAGGAAPLAVWACDVDPVAVRCAARNLAAVGGQVLQGDLYAALPAPLRGRVNTIVCNAPYVPTDTTDLLPREARLYEPRHTFDGGADGAAVQRGAAQEAAAWLAPGGRLLVETSEAAADLTRSLVQAGGLSPEVCRCEELDATVVVGTAPLQPPYTSRSSQPSSRMSSTR
jgi:release factor glutamine methyltransferase